MEARFFDDSKVRKAITEMEEHFQENAELFFEREIKVNLKNKTIYCDESIDFLDNLIKGKVINESNDKKFLYIILIGTYLGQYVISKFKGNWVYDLENCSSPLDFFIRYTKDSDLYFRPFACAINRITFGKRASLKSEMTFIKNAIKQDIEMTNRIFKNFKKKRNLKFYY